jgi:hypothetical protein
VPAPTPGRRRGGWDRVGQRRRRRRRRRRKRKRKG